MASDAPIHGSGDSALRTDLEVPHRVRHAAAFDAEVRAHGEHLRAAAAIRPGERVLDIGCGTGQSTREAAVAAAPAPVLGVDISAPMLELARQLTAAEHLDNVTYERADAEAYPFAAGRFDAAISRFGTMFFTDPVAAFANIARALRPGGRLVMLVWQRHEQNEWAVAIESALQIATPPPATLATFSLGDRRAATRTLEAAGLEAVRFREVHEPVFYGPTVADALVLVCSFRATRDALASLSPADAARTEDRLRAVLSAHLREEGVFFESRAWIITASRPVAENNADL